MSKFKIPAWSFITLHLKKINANLHTQKNSPVGICLKKLYSAVFLVTLASVLLLVILMSFNRQEENPAILPQQVQEGAAPVQAVIVEQPASAVPQTMEPLRENVQSRLLKEEPERFREVKGEVKVPFGWYLHPLYKDWRYHTGIDVDGKKGQMVAAIHSGEVTEIFRESGSGLTAVVKHDMYQVYYGSLQKVTVEKGSWVQAGQKIGKIGSFDGEPYEHLHLAIKKGEEYIDPLLLINK